MSSKIVDNILGRGQSLDAESPEYRSFMDSGGRPQMGFSITQADGTMDGFLYHNLDNLRMQVRNGSEFLTFTHRGTAVTIQGEKLKVIFRAMMRHTLMEIHERDGRASQRPEDPTIIKLAVTPPEENPAHPHLRLAKNS